MTDNDPRDTLAHEPEWHVPWWAIAIVMGIGFGLAVWTYLEQ